MGFDGFLQMYLITPKRDQTFDIGDFNDSFAKMNTTNIDWNGLFTKYLFVDTKRWKIPTKRFTDDTTTRMVKYNF